MPTTPSAAAGCSVLVVSFRVAGPSVRSQGPAQADSLGIGIFSVMSKVLVLITSSCAGLRASVPRFGDTAASLLCRSVAVKLAGVWQVVRPLVPSTATANSLLLSAYLLLFFVVALFCRYLSYATSTALASILLAFY